MFSFVVVIICIIFIRGRAIKDRTFRWSPSGRVGARELVGWRGRVGGLRLADVIRGHGIGWNV